MKISQRGAFDPIEPHFDPIEPLVDNYAKAITGRSLFWKVYNDTRFKRA